VGFRSRRGSLVTEIRFRGSLGIEVCGGRGLPGLHAHWVQAAFPDFTNTLDDLIVEGDSIAATLDLSWDGIAVSCSGSLQLGARSDIQRRGIFQDRRGKKSQRLGPGDTTSLKAAAPR